MNTIKPTILVVNDDGITAPGIKFLAHWMKNLGRVVVVAPDSPQSGMGHAVTISKPLRLDKVDLYDDLEMYQCSGTPADCVKLAVNTILHQKPDLCVSGINHGSNSSISVLYSGTMSAAMEGAIEGIPSVGFSIADFSHQANFDPIKTSVINIAQQILSNGLPQGTLLNVNYPKVKTLNGIKICRQALGKYKEEFDVRLDPSKRKYYWLTGVFDLMDNGEDTDEWALRNGYASIVPVQFDLTAYSAMKTINNWKLDV